MEPNTFPPENDFVLIWGCEDIAKEVGLTLRQCRYLLEVGRMPAKKVGNRWVAERSVLRRFFLGNGEEAA